jgi:hypothetical protein
MESIGKDGQFQKTRELDTLIALSDLSDQTDERDIPHGTDILRKT